MLNYILLQVAVQKLDQFAHSQISVGPLAELAHQVAEGELAAVARLQRLAQHNSVNRGQPKVAEEPRLGSELAVIFATMKSRNSSPRSS